MSIKEHLESAVKTMERCSSWKLLPQTSRNELIEYVLRGTRPGEFLYAVLINDLIASAQRADHANINCLRCWAQVMVWGVPMACRGTEELVENWITKGGLKGLLETHEEEKQNGCI